MKKKHYPSNEPLKTLCGHQTTPAEWRIIELRKNKTHLINCARCKQRLGISG